MQRSVAERAGTCVMLVALAASIAGLLNDFVYDDAAIIRDNLRVHDIAYWREWFTRAYWPPPYVEQLYRPVAVLLLAIQYVVGGGNPIVVRLVSYLLYAGCSFAVWKLASRVLTPTSALAAAFLFAAHPVHVEAVALGVNQGELLVGVIATTMACLYLDARRAPVPSAATWVVLTVLFAIATLTKENAFVIPGLLMCVELAFVGQRAMSQRLREVGAGFTALALTALVVFLVRSLILTDAVAVVPAADLRGLGMLGRFLALFQLIPTWARLLVFPAPLRVDYHLLPPGPAAIGLELVGAVVLVGIITVAYRLRRIAPSVTFGLAWCGVSLLPVSNLIPTGVIVGERTLLLPSAGFVIAVGGAATLAVRSWPHQDLRRRLIVACAGAVLLGVVGSAARQLSWNSAHVRITGPAAR